MAAEAAGVITTVITAAGKAIRIDIQDTPNGSEVKSGKQTGLKQNLGKKLAEILPILSMIKRRTTNKVCHQLMVAQGTVTESPKLRGFLGVPCPAWIAGAGPSTVPMEPLKGNG
jgi:predicted DNA repair protein MutK